MARKAREFTVSRGILTGRGKTKSEAKADLERQIDWALTNQTHRVEVRNGVLMIIASDAAGISSRAILVDDIKQGEKIGCYSFSGQTDYIRELRHVRLHAAMLAWEHETDDEAYIPTCGLDDAGERELRSWIKFQRSYKQHRANGMTDAQAHQAACGF